ncbi:Hsp20/alpha crystallin family protein [Dactylosporangium sp. NPDC049525]|uniref:Hsp20/alpha crystallin family protein n=1 Tax=Dactylosporangium sp. NPDC049525 TaxID=3154730 RepID=UPI003434CE01
MLMRSEPFTEVNRLAQQLFGAPATGTWSRPTAMPADAYRNGDEFVIVFDLPGVDKDAIDIDIERNVLTVRAERRPVDLGEQAQATLTERPLGVFSRQMFLGDALDTDRIDATYRNGVLALRIPIAEKAKPRKISVGGSTEPEHKVLNG